MSTFQYYVRKYYMFISFMMKAECQWFIFIYNRSVFIKPGFEKETQSNFYKVIAVPTLLYSSETWVLNQKDYSTLNNAQMV